MGKLVSEIRSEDWNNILDLDEENLNETIDNYLQNLNKIFQKNAASDKLNKQE